MVTGSIRDEYSPFLFSVHYKPPLRKKITTLWAKIIIQHSKQNFEFN